MCDPGNHSSSEWNVGIGYSWEKGLAAVGIAQWMKPGVLTPLDIDMEDEIFEDAARGSTQRNASYHFLQSVANMLQHSFGCMENHGGLYSGWIVL